MFLNKYLISLGKNPSLMLTQIVRPLVQTQVRLLANSQATKATLVSTIIRWLSYLGVSTQVNQINTVTDKIQVTITVGKPQTGDAADWNKILTNLRESENKSSQGENTTTEIEEINSTQQRKLARLLAYLIQVGNESNHLNWAELEPQLQQLDLTPELINELAAALKVPQIGDSLIEKFEPDLAALALPIIVKIALLDDKINPAENETIMRLLSIVK